MSTRKNSNLQGRDAEENVLEYLQSFLNQLGFTGLKKRKQSSGSQQGKDIQMAWVSSGNKYNWHFEVKSQRSEEILKKDILEKLDDTKRSGHEIDCWCLVALHRNPKNELDDAIQDWNARKQFPFKIVVWSPETYLPEQIRAIDQAVYGKIYGDTEPPAPNYDLGVFKNDVNTLSQEGRRARELYPKDIANSLLDSRDDASGMLGVLDRVYGFGREHKDFTIENVQHTSTGTSASIMPREGRQVTITGTFKLDPAKQKEYNEFLKLERSAIELEPQEIESIEALVGTTSILPKDGGNKLIISRPPPEFPVFSLYSKKRNYLALKRLDLPYKEVRDGALVFDNFGSGDPTWVSLVIEKDGLSFKNVHANRESPDYEIELELSTLDFWEDTVTNQAITVEDVSTHKKILEGVFMPTNIDVGDTMDAIHDFRLILKKLRDIRDFCGQKLPVPRQLTREEYDTVIRIHRAITEKEVKVRLNGSSFVVPSSKAVDDIPEGLQSEYYTVLDPYMEDLFGIPIDLGKVLMEHHNMRIEKKAQKAGVRVTMSAEDDSSYSIFKFGDAIPEGA
ncbi:MAG TPA: hypothetical protein VLF40_04960 [Candidatus Saccharimonadales bacterium]|nr:hypothetical protein [Candidatus Saccharimonadales bacterium]